METSTAEAAPLEILETEEEILVELWAVVLEADEDDKSEDNINKEKESISMIVSILETIKLSEDSVDTTKSKVCVQAPT